MPTVSDAAAETGVSHHTDLRLRHLFRPRIHRRVGMEPLAWLKGSSAHESKVTYFCIGANTKEPLIACRYVGLRRSAPCVRSDDRVRREGLARTKSLRRGSEPVRCAPRRDPRA